MNGGGWYLRKTELRLLHQIIQVMYRTSDQGYWRGSMGSVYVPNGVDQIIIEHWSVAQDCNSPNSVVPTSVCISAVPLHM